MPQRDSFTAADVKFNFDRILNPDTKSRQVPVYYRVAPAKYFQEVGAEQFAQKPVGSGPYKFVEWVKDSHTTYEANDQYWKGAPPIKKLTIRSALDASTRLAQLLTGEAARRAGCAGRCSPAATTAARHRSA